MRFVVAGCRVAFGFGLALLVILYFLVARHVRPRLPSRSAPAVAVTGVHERRGRADRRGDLVGHTSPEIDRSQTFVEEDERGPAGIADVELVLDRSTGDVDERPLTHPLHVVTPASRRRVPTCRRCPI